MKPSELLSKLATDATIRAQVLVGETSIVGQCPLGCSPIEITYNGLTHELYYGIHKGKHPNSPRCFWSELRLQDKVGQTAIVVTTLTLKR